MGIKATYSRELLVLLLRLVQDGPLQDMCKQTLSDQEAIELLMGLGNGRQV